MRGKTQSGAIFALASLCALSVIGPAVGCAAERKLDREAVRPAGVSALQFGDITDTEDRDRVALSRFVGAWDFTGWYDPPGESRRETAGIAAGTIENEYFVLLDSARVSAQNEILDLSSGAMLLSVEPRVGLMLTGWSSASPAVHRFKGDLYADRSRFVFNEFRAPEGRDQLRLVIQFQTDDRFTAEFFRKHGGSEHLAATYTFDRAE